MKFSSFSLLFLAIVALLLSHNAEAKHKNMSGISPFCRTANNKRLCNRMVNGAANWHDASINVITVAINYSKRIQALTPFVVQAAAHLPTNTRISLISTCTEDFENTVEDLQLSIELLNTGDMGALDSRLSSAYNSDCSDALTNEGATVFLLTKLNDHFAKIMDSTLAVVQERPFA